MALSTAYGLWCHCSLPQWVNELHGILDPFQCSNQSTGPRSKTGGSLFYLSKGYNPRDTTYNRRLRLSKKQKNQTNQ